MDGEDGCMLPAVHLPEDEGYALQRAEAASLANDGIEIVDFTDC